MNWNEFIRNLLENEFKLSSYEAENLTGIRAQIIDRWKRGTVGKPQRNTIRRLEAGLGITINDSDPENITFKKTVTISDNTSVNKLNFLTEDDFISVPIHGHVHAGVNAPIFSEEVIETLRIPKSGYTDLHGVVVYGDSMEPIFTTGDHAIVSLSAKAVNGDVCLVAWNNFDYVLKRVFFNENTDYITLVSDNKKYPPDIVHTSEIKSILPVVDLHKKRENLRSRV